LSFGTCGFESHPPHDLPLTLAPTSLYAYERASLLIPLPYLDLEQRIRALGEDWARKNEFHVTAAHTPAIAERLRRDHGLANEEAFGTAWAAIREASHECRVGEVALTGELRTVREGAERTIVEMCDVEGLADLYAWLSKRVETELAPPPAHVTLYTAPGGKAIGLHTSADLELLTTPIDGAIIPRPWMPRRESS
jgi:hypothetical protein